MPDPAPPVPPLLTPKGITFEKAKGLMVTLALGVLSGYQFWKGNDANGLTVFALFLMSAGGSSSMVTAIMGLGAMSAATHRVVQAVEANQQSTDHAVVVAEETNLRVQDIQNNPVMPGTPSNPSMPTFGNDL